MKKRILVLAALGLLGSQALAGPQRPASTPTADELVSRYVRARGGREKFAALRTLKFTGRVTNLGIESPFTMQMKKPDRVRTDMTINTVPMIQAYDGKTAWIVMPLLG